MTERVEEIRQWHRVMADNFQNRTLPLTVDAFEATRRVGDLLTALDQAEKALKVMNENLNTLALVKQQAERGREEYKRLWGILAEQNRRLNAKVSEWQAEVERLTRFLHDDRQIYRVLQEREADLARVRAISDEALMGLIDVREALTYFERIRAALEGRG